MKYNAKSPYEKPMAEIPASCSACACFDGGTMCTANGCRSMTYGFCEPMDRCRPGSLNCFWWYANKVWDKASPHKIIEAVEERAHLFVFHRMAAAMPDGTERKKLIDHYFRLGGGRLIDFTIWPEARGLYEEFKNQEAGGNA